MKIKLFYLLILSSLLLLNETTYSKTRATEVWTWTCEANSREKEGFRVVQDKDGDGVFDWQTIKLCNGALIECAYPTCTSGVLIDTVPELYDPSSPQFSDSQTQWQIIQRDSSTNQIVYRVIHIYSSDSTYIDAGLQEIHLGIEIPYLQGEYPDILKDIIIKPNPTNNIIDIIFNSAASYNVEIGLGNIAGKVVYNYTMHVERNGDNKFRIDVSSYPSGVYFIKFDASGLSHTMQVVITH